MNKKKLFNLRYGTLASIFILIFIIGGARTYDDVKRNTEIMNNKAIEINRSIENSYKQKLDNLKELIIFNGELLSSSSKVKELIKARNRKELYTYSEIYHTLLKEITKNKNIRIHYHLPNHESFLRVHKKDFYGDNLKVIRPIIRQTIFEQESLSGFEHGKHDKNQITYRTTFPVFDKNELIAVLEIGLDVKKVISDIEQEFALQNKKIYIVDRIKEGTINYFDYMEQSLNIKQCIYQKTEEIAPILEEYQKTNSNHITIDTKSYSLVFDKIKIYDFEYKQTGSFVYIIDVTDDLIQNREFFYSSISKPILAVVLLMVLVNFIFKFFYKEFHKMENRTKNIINAQTSFMILTNGEKLLECNQTLLDFFGFETLDDFKNKYECICDTFEEKQNYLKKYNDGYLWIDYMTKYKDSFFKVAIKDLDNKTNVFTISLSKYIEDQKTNEIYYVATLTNITELENANLRLIEQSKQASLGEMMGNIAHQWRQPLSTISTISSSIQVYDKMGILNNEDLMKKMQIILDKTSYLSETIDIFRNFLKEKKVKTNIVLQDRIDIALSIVDSTLKDNHIELVNNIDYSNKIKTVMVVGELSQVLINILNNAKDVLIDKNISNPKVILSMIEEKDKAIISIEDNGGGIDEDILLKIFEPYFTTKHQTQGTGLGLHMSYKIVKESLNGDIYVKNTTLGAKFFIEVPLIKST